MRQPLDYLGAPALLSLPGQDVTANLPVEQHQFAVYRQRGALLSSVDAFFEVGQPVAVAFGGRGEVNRGVAHVFSPRGFLGPAFALSAAILVFSNRSVPLLLALAASSCTRKSSKHSGFRILGMPARTLPPLPA